MSDESGEQRSDKQGDKEQGVRPVLPELNCSLSMDHSSEALDLVNESKLVGVEPEIHPNLLQ